jgi:hypothetical protein
MPVVSAWSSERWRRGFASALLLKRARPLGMASAQCPDGKSGLEQRFDQPQQRAH